MAFGPMRHVNSTMIEAIAWDGRESELLVQFKGKDSRTGKPRPQRSYVYKDVPKYVFDELLAADRREHASVGKVFYSLVRQEPAYEYELVHVKAA